MKSLWIALPAVFLSIVLISLARPNVASAGRTTQDLNYAYSVANSTLTLSTQSFDPALMPAIMVPSLKVDGTIFAFPPDCTFNGVVRQCTFSGVVAPDSIAAAVVLLDSAAGTVLEGKTRIHCHKVATDGCAGVKTVGLH